MLDELFREHLKSRSDHFVWFRFTPSVSVIVGGRMFTMELLAALEPHRERIGQVAGMLTVAQYIAGWFICNDIRRRRTTVGVSPLRFIGGCGLSILQLQYSQKLQAPALIWTSIITLTFSMLYSLWFCWYTPVNLRSSFYRLTIGAATITAGLYAYGAQGDSPEIMYRLGLVLTVLALAFIALPLVQLRSIIRAKSSAGLPLPAILASTGATILWLLYGLLINNTFIVVQKIIAMGLCTVQLSLFIIYPASKADERKKQH